MKVNPEHLHDLLECDPLVGSLVWKRRTSGSSRRAINRWNACYAGKPAFTTLEAKGYLSGKLFGKRLKAHRVIWAMVHGEWPIEIDHINGDKCDNRIANLRNVDHRENSRNRKTYLSNGGRQQGVYLRPNGRWVSVLTVDYRRITLGTFDREDDAIAARIAGEKSHGFHNNHGRI